MPNHSGGAELLQERQKIPTISQVLSSIRFICLRKTSGSNMGGQTCPGSRRTTFRPWQSHRSHVLFVKVVTTFTKRTCHDLHIKKRLAWQHASEDLHILVTAPFCCDRKGRRQVRKASHCGSKQQQRSCAAITLRLR